MVLLPASFLFLYNKSCLLPHIVPIHLPHNKKEANLHNEGLFACDPILQTHRLYPFEQPCTPNDHPQQPCKSTCPVLSVQARLLAAVHIGDPHSMPRPQPANAVAEGSRAPTSQHDATGRPRLSGPAPATAAAEGTAKATLAVANRKASSHKASAPAAVGGYNASSHTQGPVSKKAADECRLQAASTKQAGSVPGAGHTLEGRATTHMAPNNRAQALTSSRAHVSSSGAEPTNRQPPNSHARLSAGSQQLQGAVTKQGDQQARSESQQEPQLQQGSQQLGGETGGVGSGGAKDSTVDGHAFLLDDPLDAMAALAGMGSDGEEGEELQAAEDRGAGSGSRDLDQGNKRGAAEVDSDGGLEIIEEGGGSGCMQGAGGGEPAAAAAAAALIPALPACAAASTQSGSKGGGRQQQQCAGGADEDDDELEIIEEECRVGGGGLNGGVVRDIRGSQGKQQGQQGLSQGGKLLPKSGGGGEQQQRHAQPHDDVRAAQLVPVVEQQPRPGIMQGRTALQPLPNGTQAQRGKAVASGSKAGAVLARPCLPAAQPRPFVPDRRTQHALISMGLMKKPQPKPVQPSQQQSSQQQPQQQQQARPQARGPGGVPSSASRAAAAAAPSVPSSAMAAAFGGIMSSVQDVGLESRWVRSSSNAFASVCLLEGQNMR